MTKRVMVGHDALFGPWLAHMNGNRWVPGFGSTIGLWDEELCVPLAACYYEGCNGASIRGHLAGVGKKWMNREFLWFCFYYPFIQLGVNKIIGLVSSDNLGARKLDEHLGFVLEATLKDATPKGDMLIYTMTKDQCRWLTLKGENVKTRSASTA